MLILLDHPAKWKPSRLKVHSNKFNKSGSVEKFDEGQPDRPGESKTAGGIDEKQPDRPGNSIKDNRTGRGNR
jgi:hypothetical protein